MSIITTAILKKTMKVVEKEGNWGSLSGKEFLSMVTEAHQKKAISDETAFDLTIRAMAIRG